MDLPLPSSIKNIILCRTNNIPIGATCDIADSIISIASSFRKKSSGTNVSVCGLILHDECWSVNRVIINEVNEILKHQCSINGFAFIFQDHGWTFTNGSLDCSLFCKDLLYLIEQGNVKLAKSTSLTISSWYNQINLSLLLIATHHIVILPDKKFNLTFLFHWMSSTFHCYLISFNLFCLTLVNQICININLLVMWMLLVSI